MDKVMALHRKSAYIVSVVSLWRPNACVHSSHYSGSWDLCYWDQIEIPYFVWSWNIMRLNCYPWVKLYVFWSHAHSYTYYRFQVSYHVDMQRFTLESYMVIAETVIDDDAHCVLLSLEGCKKNSPGNVVQAYTVSVCICVYNSTINNRGNGP